MDNSITIKCTESIFSYIEMYLFGLNFASEPCIKSISIDYGKEVSRYTFENFYGNWIIKTV